MEENKDTGLDVSDSTNPPLETAFDISWRIWLLCGIAQLPDWASGISCLPYGAGLFFIGATGRGFDGKELTRG